MVIRYTSCRLRSRLCQSTTSSRWKGLTHAGNAIEPNIGGLGEALKSCVNHHHKGVIADAVQLCTQLVKAMGFPFSSSGRVLISPVLKTAGDAKPHIRAAVADFVVALVGACGWSAIEDKLSAAFAAASCTGVAKQTLLEAYAQLVKSSARPRNAADTVVVVQGCGHSLTDKASGPRTQAASLMADLLASSVAAHVLQAAQKLPEAQRAAVKEQLGKAGVSGAAPGPSPRPGSANAQRRNGVQSNAGELRSNNGAVANSSLTRSAASRPGTAGSRSGIAARPPTRSGTATAADSNEPLIKPADEAEKQKRTVPPRSFKFEMRTGEAADVKKELTPHVSAGLASTMFSSDWQKHNVAATQLQVRPTSPQPALTRMHAVPDELFARCTFQQ